MAGPERIDRFEVEALLGAGAFATVWLARDPVLDLRVAIKVLADNWSRDPDIRRRFIEEARVLWQANSPRIVRVHHVSELPDGRPYFVMTWADRGTLRQRMDARFRASTVFSPSEACSIVSELAQAVADVHDCGRIHRDIKPGNVLIRSAERRRQDPIHGLVDDEQLVLADFGLAREIEASAITLVSGSPAYVAPEQAGGLDQLTERADLYPLGLIAVELMSGTSPCTRATMADAALTGELDIGGHLRQVDVAISPGLEGYLRSMCHPDPSRRPASADEMARSLAGFSADAGGPPSGAVPPVMRGPVGSRSTTAVQADPSSNPPVNFGPGQGSNPPSPNSPSPVRPGSPAPSATGQWSDPPAQPAPQGFSPVVNQGLQDRGPAGDGRTGSRAVIWIAVAAAVIAIGAGATGLMLSGGGGESSGSSTTSGIASGAGTDASTSSTTAADAAPSEPVSVETLPVDDIELPRIPLPDRSVLKDDDDLRTLANVARTVDDLVVFYRSVDDPAWTVGDIEVTDEVARFEMTSSDRNASVTLSPTAQGAGSGISEIEAVYRAP